MPRILIADYDPQWPDVFRRERGRVKELLGERALRIEHVGSTSVPGLAAKPIIDMILEVSDSAAEDAYVPVLEAAGYFLKIREPHWHQHRMFKGPQADINLHVFSVGCPEIDRMLAFRDWLRRSSSDCALYLRTKRELAEREWERVQNYADAKTEVVGEILAHAAMAGK